MLIGYARVSKADGSQSLDLQHDALRAAGVERDNIYDDLASGGRDDRPGLTACLKSLRDGDVLVVWKLDRLGRSLAHLVNTVKELSDRKIGLRVLTGKAASSLTLQQCPLRSTPRLRPVAWCSESSPPWPSSSGI